MKRYMALIIVGLFIFAGVSWLIEDNGEFSREEEIPPAVEFEGPNERNSGTLREGGIVTSEFDVNELNDSLQRISVLKELAERSGKAIDKEVLASEQAYCRGLILKFPEFSEEVCD